MTATIGFLAVLFAAVSSAGMVVRGFRAMRDPSRAVGRYFQWPVYGVLAGAFVAMSALEIGLLRDDFSIEYVANNSASTTPFVFKVASAWAALEGSILLWGLVLAVFIFTVHRQFARSEQTDRLGAGALAVLDRGRVLGSTATTIPGQHRRGRGGLVGGRPLRSRHLDHQARRGVPVGGR